MLSCYRVHAALCDSEVPYISYTYVDSDVITGDQSTLPLPRPQGHLDPGPLSSKVGKIAGDDCQTMDTKSTMFPANLGPFDVVLRTSCGKRCASTQSHCTHLAGSNCICEKAGVDVSYPGVLHGLIYTAEISTTLAPCRTTRVFGSLASAWTGASGQQESGSAGTEPESDWDVRRGTKASAKTPISANRVRDLTQQYIDQWKQCNPGRFAEMPGFRSTLATDIL